MKLVELPEIRIPAPRIHELSFEADVLRDGTIASGSHPSQTIVHHLTFGPATWLRVLGLLRTKIEHTLQLTQLFQDRRA